VSEAPAVDEIVVAAEATAWRDAGFDVLDDGRVRVGSVTLEIAGAAAGKRIVCCAMSGINSGDFDGLPIERSQGPRAVNGSSPPHPNGVTRIDYIVAFTPDLDRTVAAGQALGLDLRRIRDEPAPAGSPRQAFFRIGEILLEVAQAPPGSPLKPDTPAASLGDLCGDPRDAVQPGRIATVRKQANLGLPVAFMTPRPA
jgi:hypothetical protein